jgi:putative CRISPR-associated protein (TIGR02619 family)
MALKRSSVRARLPPPSYSLAARVPLLNTLGCTIGYRMRTIITSVGTALITNAARKLGRQPTSEDLAAYVRDTSWTEASAELNVLDKLAIGDRDQVVLVHSDTDEGRLCAGALNDLLKTRCDCRMNSVPGMTYDAATFDKALGAFASLLVDEAKKARKLGREPHFAAAGGFKAQTAFAAIVGLLIEAPVYYVHEKFDRLVTMPPVPLGWKFELVSDYEDFFEELHKDGLEYDIAQRRLKQLPPEVRKQFDSLLHHEDGLSMLSPMGETVYAAFLALNPLDEKASILLSEVASEQFESANGDELRHYRRLLGRISNAELRTGGAKINSDCRFYPPGGAVNQHVAYFEEGDDVVVAEFFTSHQDRDKKMDAGKVMRASYKGRIRYSG